MVWLLLNVLVEISCWQQRQRVELHGTHFPVWWLILVFMSFSLLWMLLVPIVCFRLVPFLKAIMGSMLKVSLQLWFACNMCQCFVIISFKFGNDQLCVTNNGMHCLSWHFCWWSSCFQSSWSTFWICCVTSFLYPLLTNCSRSFLEWLWYSWNVEHICRIRSIWLWGIHFFNEYGCSNFALRKLDGHLIFGKE